MLNEGWNFVHFYRIIERILNFLDLPRIIVILTDSDLCCTYAVVSIFDIKTILYEGCTQICKWPSNRWKSFQEVT